MEKSHIRRASNISSMPLRPRREPLHAIETTILIAVLLATVFVAWTPTSFSAVSFADKLALLLTPQPVNNPAAGPVQQALALVGLLIGAIPSIPNPELSPDAVLFIFLPILLFEGAWTVEVSKLIANWLLVLLLAVPGLL